MDNSAWRGAPLARSDEGEYLAVFNRRATPPAGMDLRAECSDYLLRGPKTRSLFHMRQVLSMLATLTALVLLCDSAQAQVNFQFHGGGWGYQPGVVISVGPNNGNCAPVYQNNYPYVNTGYNTRVPVRRNRGYRANNCPPAAYWCNAHSSYCTHRAYNLNQGYSQAYWCQGHNSYCTHR